MAILKAIFVDFDGTLVDSELANAHAYRLALQEVGISCSLQTLESLIIGNHWSQFLPKIVGAGYSAELGQDIATRKKKQYSTFYHSINVNIPLVKLLTNLSPNISLAVVSNASQDSINDILAAKELGQLFKFVIGSEDFKKGKPDPEPYVLAMKKLNILPDECLAIEDSEAGFQSATAAGIKILKVQIS